MNDKKLNDLVGRFSERGKVDADDDVLRMIDGLDDEPPATPPNKMPRGAKERSEQDQLPLWPMATRGVPNAVLRSALFGVVQKGRRKHCNEMEVPSVGGLKVTFTGMRLDQGDLDVWEQCLSLAKENGLGERIEFTANSFLRSVDRKTGNSQHIWLRQSLKRLNAAQVEISDKGRAYFGTLIQDGYRDDETGHYVINLNPKLSRLYGQNHWTQVQWDERHALKRPLSQWLHGFYSSHKEPFPIKTETLLWLCGSETKDLRRFRQSLGLALKEVQAVTDWKCWIGKDDKINVARPRRIK